MRVLDQSTNELAESAPDSGTVVALSGGIGGAKLALGLAHVLDAGTLTVIANTGDDFRHLGLAISPDVDTLLYTLSGLADPLKGWGRRDETWTFMTALAQLGGETWFQLGDGDLALHVERTRRLAAGESLSAITDDFRHRFGISARVVPMSDDSVRTRVRTDEGWLDFQDYFVRRRCEPAVRAVVYEGAEAAQPSAGALRALRAPGLRAIVICPSNPMLSIEPMLAVSGLRAALVDCPAPVIAVSPLIAGQAVKGPTAKILRELGFMADTAEMARRYTGLIDALIVDHADAGATLPAGVAMIEAPILMKTLGDRERLARKVLATADQLSARSSMNHDSSR